MTEDYAEKYGLDPARIPAHVAMIMDGNGRWAASRGLPRTRGHEEGAESVRAVVEMCGRVGVKELTLYAFSTENWSRPKREVSFLMRLLQRFLVSERDKIMENGARVTAIGRLHELPKNVQKELTRTVSMSAENDRILLRFALNYGGRYEIVDAARRFAAAVAAGEIAPDELDPDTFRRFLYDPEMTDPDLLIRTGGEMRLSNFLLWQLSYTELYVTQSRWPEFREPELAEAFRAYAARERRFGQVLSRPKRKRSPARRASSPVR